MRTRPTSEHADAVARRLEQLRAELEPPDDEVDDGEDDGEDWQPSWWDGAAPAAPVATEADADTDTAELDPLVPVPGRHASRREVTISPDAVLPEPLRGRVSLGPWHLVIVSLVLVAGLALACWWMIRSDPEVVPAARAAPSASPMVALPTGSAAPGSVAATPTAGASAGTVTVDVEGKVPKPGIVVLPVGSRVVDAVEAAGGSSHKHLAGLNLAALLTDGQQIVVGAPSGAGPGGGAAPGAAASAAGAPAPGGARVSLNAASMQELETLPGVGPVTAQAIIDWRTSNGSFTSVDELLEVDGIGPKTMASLEPLVTL
ncbi:competence protein ComEA [Nocardioides albertanoniae]|uniref:Competence protein ComEA n=1 Tax=Nocardioides albertanoniae TaxID=1175486 RepID=A0A543A518_9ACTN|nr:helix-hairpin-helix domain-containing protein [Nocardioides albertanoniae]TQL67690.1 competence protein ComEA [Nocardioides albertanoniae]